MGLKIANNAVSTLAASITEADLTISVQPADAGKFPVLDEGDWHPATIIDAANNLEIVRVTARAGNVLTVLRAQEGTTAKNFVSGARIDVRITGATIAALVTRAELKSVAYSGSFNDLTDKPAPVNTATVGAAIAAANAVTTPDDGDTLAGVKAGTSTIFRWTWGNIKAALTTLFDGRFLKLVGGVISGSLTIQPPANAAMLEMRAAANGACLIDFSPNGYGGDFNWRIIAQPNNAELDFLRNGAHLFRVNSDGNLWTAYLGWLSDRFADRGARVQREGGIWEFGSIDPNYNARTSDAPAPYVLVGLRSSNGTNVINLRAELLRNN